jgi:hypothetical protein
MRECTCIGTCRGKEGLASGYRCALDGAAPTGPGDGERHSDELLDEVTRDVQSAPDAGVAKDILRAFAMAVQPPSARDTFTGRVGPGGRWSGRLDCSCGQEAALSPSGDTETPP